MWLLHGSGRGHDRLAVLVMAIMLYDRHLSFALGHLEG